MFLPLSLPLPLLLFLSVSVSAPAPASVSVSDPLLSEAITQQRATQQAGRRRTSAPCSLCCGLCLCVVYLRLCQGLVLCLFTVSVSVYISDRDINLHTNRDSLSLPVFLSVKVYVPFCPSLCRSNPCPCQPPSFPLLSWARRKRKLRVSPGPSASPSGLAAGLGLVRPDTHPGIPPPPPTARSYCSCSYRVCHSSQPGPGVAQKGQSYLASPTQSTQRPWRVGNPDIHTVTRTSFELQGSGGLGN